MYIVDSQMHVWLPPTPERPWPHGTDRHRTATFTKEDGVREMDAAQVNRAVIVPPWWHGEHNDFALDAVRSYPGRFGIMGLLDADAADSKERLRHWREQPGMLGIRFSSLDPKYRTALTDKRIDWLWGAAEQERVPVMMGVEPSELPLVGLIADRHPALRITVDHFGRRHSRKDSEAFPNMSGLLDLAKRPNVAVKASGMPAYSSEAYPYRGLHEYLRQGFDAFGPRRLFWGTDLTKLPCTYRQAVTMFTEELPWLSDEDKQWIMGRGLCEWLGWDDALNDISSGVEHGGRAT